MPALWDGYRAPIAAFIAATTGCPPHDADDVTQAFFTAMLKPDFFAGFDPARGRFRSWLRIAAKRFHYNWRRQYWREQVGAEPAAMDAGSERPWDDLPEPDRAFDRALAETLVRRALERLRRRYAEEGQEGLFAELYRGVLGERRNAQDAAVSKLTGRSISALKKAWFDQKAGWALRYQACLREEISAFGVKRSAIAGVIADLLDAWS